jgi:hypothetical protein
LNVNSDIIYDNWKKFIQEQQEQSNYNLNTTGFFNNLSSSQISTNSIIRRNAENSNPSSPANLVNANRLTNTSSLAVENKVSL